MRDNNDVLRAPLQSGNAYHLAFQQQVLESVRGRRVLPNHPTLADAILDRVLHAAHRLPLSGESQCKPEKAKSGPPALRNRVIRSATRLGWTRGSGHPRRG